MPTRLRARAPISKYSARGVLQLKTRTRGVRSQGDTTRWVCCRAGAAESSTHKRIRLVEKGVWRLRTLHSDCFTMTKRG
eukprot:727630-Prymnesium_polylepis.1